MGLFDKKICDICSEKIGLFGNRKLEDGNLCKACAAKLSPWFSERRHSSLEEIRRQLAYREENRAAVGAFHCTRSLGRNTKILFDEDARKFLVTSASDLEKANPDVLDISQVTGCSLDVDEHKRELKHKDKDGHEVSFNPRRYEYSYDFYGIIDVNHPYFDEMRFRLNASPVETGQRSINSPVPHYRLSGGTYTDSVATAAVDGLLSALVGEQRRDAATWNEEYNSYLDMGNEICDLLLRLRRREREKTEAQAKPKKPVICPFCGATTTPTAKGCCEYCDSPLKG